IRLVVAGVAAALLLVHLVARVADDELQRGVFAAGAPLRGGALEPAGGERRGLRIVLRVVGGDGVVAQGGRLGRLVRQGRERETGCGDRRHQQRGAQGEIGRASCRERV